MRNTLETISQGYDIYSSRRPEFSTQNRLPFRVSPLPLSLTREQKSGLSNLGQDVVSYLRVCDELYHSDARLRHILDKGKPEIFLVDRPANYLFVRPDIIITPSGFAMCEIETSPFGLALAEILNKAYRYKNIETMVGENDLSSYIHEAVPSDGTILFSDKTRAYKGQLMFLADKTFSSENRKWKAEYVTEIGPGMNDNIYRAFYLSEYVTDSSVRLLFDGYKGNQTIILPSLTPHMEEKAVLALLWDKRWENIFRKQLGPAAFNHLKAVIPATWIVGEEKYFAPGLPGGIESSVDLALLSRSKRAYVLKTSGFSAHSSWGEGVTFLHDKSREQAKEKLHRTATDESTLHVIQEFRKAVNIPLFYESEDGIHPMSARIRITPYYATLPANEGRMIAIKATGVENTDYIHASSESINTAVS